MVLNRLSIQSRFMLLLLFVSLLSILVVGLVTFHTASEMLRERTFRRLEGLRHARADQISDRIELIRKQVITTAESNYSARAFKDFREAFSKLEKTSLKSDEIAKLKGIYEKQFLPELRKRTDGEPSLETYFPNKLASQYLQYHYMASNPNPTGEGDKLEESTTDTSDYAAVHKKYHAFFQRFTSRFGFEDVLLVNPDSGEVLYTTKKFVELGRSLYQGPFAQSSLANLVRSIQKQSDRKTFRIADFESYFPSYGQPAAFVASPVFDGPDRIGVVVFRFPVNDICEIVNGEGNWERDGLGQTGECMLIGADNLMRNVTRGMIEDPDQYLKQLRKTGYTATAVDRIRLHKSPILQQAVRTKPVELALLGQDGTDVYQDYSGHECLYSYGPLEVEGLNWVLVAKIHKSEAFAPAYLLARQILLVMVVVGLVVCCLAVIMARMHLRPIQRIRDAVRDVMAGNSETRVKLETEDEFRELGDAFNDMADKLRTKSVDLERKCKENDDLMLNILPGQAATRVRNGEAAVADRYADISVIFAELEGFPELDGRQPPDKSLDLLNELIGAFDEQADRFSVEKIRTMGLSYLAVCGMSVSRVDHANRIVEFAQEILQVVQRFNKERGTNVNLRIGVNSGPVVGGILGRSKFIYELWGSTISTARELKNQGKINTIQISPSVQERLRDLYEFERQPEVVKMGQVKVSAWSIKNAA